MASDVTTRDMSGAMANARRTAANSVAFLKGAAGLKPAEAPSEHTPEIPAPIPAPSPSIISVNAAMTGSITTPDELLVHGTIDGDIRASKISICAGGIVRGDVTAEIVIIHGSVEGRITGQDVHLAAGAIVSGEITHGTLGIDTAAVFEGSIKRVPRSTDAIAAE